MTHYARIFAGAMATVGVHHLETSQRQVQSSHISHMMYDPA